MRYVKPRITDKRIPLNYVKEQVIVNEIEQVKVNEIEQVTQNKKPMKGILKKTQKVNLPKVIPNIEDFRVGTSKKNDYYKPKSDSLYEKTKSYLNQCNRIKKAYKEKHREIQRIFNYVKKLYESKPDIPIKDANINEIIQYLENNIKIEDIKKKNIELNQKRKEQNEWIIENEKIYKELMERLKKMKQ